MANLWGTPRLIPNILMEDREVEVENLHVCLLPHFYLLNSYAIEEFGTTIVNGFIFLSPPQIAFSHMSRRQCLELVACN